MAKILNALVLVIALLFAGIGLKAAADTDAFLTQFGLAVAQPLGVAEVRCFFGGNFLTWAILLVAGYFRPELRRGFWLSVAIAMIVIVLLRLVSMAVDGMVEFHIGAIAAELAFAAILIAAQRGARQQSVK